MRRLALGMSLALAIVPRAVFADTFVWIGPASGSWNSAANWMNTSGGVSTVPDADDDVVFNSDVSTTNGLAFTLTNSATLTLGVGTVSIVGPTVTNSGTITFSGNAGTENNEVLEISQATTLGGTGEVVLVEWNDSWFTGSGTLTNAAGHTIRGQGGFSGVDVVNEGNIVAEGSWLQFWSNTTTNSGTIEVASDGTLYLADNAVIEGGTLHGTEGANLHGDGSGTLRDLTVTGTIAQRDGTTNLDGTITNNGALTFLANESGLNKFFQIPDTATLAGSGEVVMVEWDDSWFTGSGTLTNAAGHTIRGQGGFSGVDVVNEGNIVAEGSWLQFWSNTTTNSGTIGVASDGTLYLADNAVIEGGTLHGTEGANLHGDGSGTLRDLTVTGTIAQRDGTTNLDGTITNNGALTFLANESGLNKFFQIPDTATLAGSGEVVMVEWDDSWFTGSGTLTNAAGHTIRGQGGFSGVDVVNEGNIVAEGSWLQFWSNTTTNSGTIEVASDGTLYLADNAVIEGGTLHGTEGANLHGNGSGTLRDLTVTGTIAQRESTTNLDGTITNHGELTFVADGSGLDKLLSVAAAATLAGAGEVVMQEWNDSWFTGSGTLTNAAGHTIRGQGGFSGVDVVNEGNIVAEGNWLQFWTNTTTNSGTIEVVSDGTLYLADNAVIEGGTLHGTEGANLHGNGSGTLRDLTITGTIAQRESTTNLDGTITNHGELTFVADGSGLDKLLSVATAATLAGAGEVVMQEWNDSWFTGSGTLTNAAGHTIRGQGGFSGVDVVNEGNIVAEGSWLQFWSNTTTNSGTIEVASDGTLYLADNAVIEGGTLHGTEGANLHGDGSGTLRDLTVTGTIAQRDGTTNLDGTITNNGALTFLANESGLNKFFQIPDTATLAGSGEVVMVEWDDSWFTGSGTLTNAAGHTIRGQGGFSGVDVVNEGNIVAEGSWLQFWSNTTTNSGTIEVASDGTLYLADNAVIEGGTLHGTEGARLHGDGSGTLRDLTVTGTIAQRASTTNLEGTITNNGELTFVADGSGLDKLIQVAGAATLAGTGEVVMREWNDSWIFGDGTLTNASEHTIRGTGNISVDLLNRGMLLGESATNQIRVYADLYGIGDVSNVEIHGLHAPGESPGQVNLGGHYELTPTATLEIELGGRTPGLEHDRLDSTGDVTLAGTLRIENVDLGAGLFQPDFGDALVLITADGELSGAFTSVTSVNLDPILVYKVFYDYEIDVVTLSIDTFFDADFDIDGDVDGEDFLVWQAGFGTAEGATQLSGDADEDGDVDGEDFLVWQNQFGASLGDGGQTAIPEPCSLLLMLAFAAGLPFRRTRRGD